MHYNCAWYTKFIYPTNCQVYTETHIDVIRQNAFSHASVMVIGVSRDFKSCVNCCIANVEDLQKSTEFLLNSLFVLRNDLE